MWRKTIQVIFALAFCIELCASAPHQKFREPLSEDEPEIILGEGIVSAKLNLQPSSKIEDIQALNNKKGLLTAFKESADEVEKIGNDPVDFGKDEYIAELPNDQYNHPVAPAELLNINNKRASIRVPSNSPVTVASANPIYITIPIYLSKGDGQPLRLSVGGQEIPLTPKAVATDLNETPLSPTSQYNRLLKQNSTQSKQHKKSKRKSSGKKKRHHTTPRKVSHRKHSSIDSHEYADKQFLSYRFYF